MNRGEGDLPATEEEHQHPEVRAPRLFAALQALSLDGHEQARAELQAAGVGEGRILNLYPRHPFECLAEASLFGLLKGRFKIKGLASILKDQSTRANSLGFALEPEQFRSWKQERPEPNLRTQGLAVYASERLADKEAGAHFIFVLWTAWWAMARRAEFDVALRQHVDELMCWIADDLLVGLDGEAIDA